MTNQTEETIDVVLRDVQALGLVSNPTIGEIYDAASVAGLALCPTVASPFLRLAIVNQHDAVDMTMSNGSAPTGSITVAAHPRSVPSNETRGFYPRSVLGESWLRGYRCSDDYLWSAADVFAFRAQ